MSLDPKFAINNNLDIMRKLNIVWQRSCLVTVSFGSPTVSFITAIINIDQKRQILRLCAAPKDYLTQQLLAANEINFSTHVAGIQVRFSQTKVSISQIKGQNVINVAIPDTLYWLEHRYFYRIRSPMSNPASCDMEIRLNSDGSGLPRKYTFKLYDMSISGLALIHETDAKINFLRPNSVFDNCHITLPEIGDFYGSIEVRNQRPLNSTLPDKTQLVGVRFINPSPVVETKTQRYIQWIERENIKIKKNQ
jgi:c-di-GMP-binding flagellar brake protein YcgR